MKYIATLLCTSLLISGPVLAETTHGEKLHAENCISCHTTRLGFGNNGTDIYTRPQRRVQSLPGLKKQVNRCKNMLGITWFDEDVAAVVQHLNKNFYKFPEN